MKSHLKTSVSVRVCLFCAIAVTSSWASAALWKLGGTGISNNGNWTNTYSSGVRSGWDAVPKAVGATASICDNSGSVNVDITLNVDAVVGVLKPNQRSLVRILSDGTHRLTLQDTSGSADLQSAGRQSLTVVPDVVLVDGLLVTMSAPGSGLTTKLIVQGAISGTGSITVNQSGSGEAQSDLEFAALNHSGSVTITSTAPSDPDRSARTAAKITGTIGSTVTTLTFSGSYNATSALYSTLELSGAGNAYSTTILNGGKLIVASGSNLGGEVLEIASGAKLTLNGTVGSVMGSVTSLTLGGVEQTAPGSYGSTASGAVHQDNTYFTGNGVVKLFIPPTMIIVE